MIYTPIHLSYLVHQERKYKAKLKIFLLVFKEGDLTGEKIKVLDEPLMNQLYIHTHIHIHTHTYFLNFEVCLSQQFVAVSNGNAKTLQFRYETLKKSYIMFLTTITRKIFTAFFCCLNGSYLMLFVCTTIFLKPTSVCCCLCTNLKHLLSTSYIH